MDMYLVRWYKEIEYKESLALLMTQLQAEEVVPVGVT